MPGVAAGKRHLSLVLLFMEESTGHASRIMTEKTSKRLRDRAEELLGDSGETYAREAGIRLQDKPSPLYQLLVLSTVRGSWALAT